MIDFANDTSVRLRIICHDCHWTVQARTLNRFVQKGLCSPLRLAYSPASDHAVICR